MTDPRFKRYARQMRLGDVGAGAQEKWRAARVVVGGASLAARVEALYLAGAGVGVLVAAEPVGREARALNPEVSIESGVSGSEPSASFDLVDPACAAVGAGALAALRELKAVLGAS